MNKSTTSPHFPTIRVNLLHAHGSPTNYLYKNRGCRCVACRAVKSEYNRKYIAGHAEEWAERSRKYYAEHREKQAEYGRKYRADHPEQFAAYGRSAVRAEQQRQYRGAHHEEIAAYARNRRARVLNASGTHTPADVRAQYDRQRGRCYWCEVKVEWRKKHVDHVVPVILSGSNGPENIVIACAHCNLTKQAMHPMDFAGVLC